MTTLVVIEIKNLTKSDIDRETEWICCSLFFSKILYYIIN